MTSKFLVAVLLLTGLRFAEAADLVPAPVPDWLKQGQQLPDKVQRVMSLLTENKFDATQPKSMRQLSKACEILLRKDDIGTLNALLALCKKQNVEIKDVQLTELFVSHAYHTRLAHEAAYKKQMENYNLAFQTLRKSRIIQAQSTVAGFNTTNVKDSYGYNAQCTSALVTYKPHLTKCTELLALARDTNPSFKPKYDIEKLIYPETEIENRLIGNAIAKETEEMKKLHDQFKQLSTQASKLGMPIV
jgi:hypothetical protein